MHLTEYQEPQVVKIEFDTDDGKEVYEIELIDSSFEYEIKIDATTGQIIEFDKDDLDYEI